MRNLRQSLHLLLDLGPIQTLQQIDLYIVGDHHQPPDRTVEQRCAQLHLDAQISRHNHFEHLAEFVFVVLPILGLHIGGGWRNGGR